MGQACSYVGLGSAAGALLGLSLGVGAQNTEAFGWLAATLGSRVGLLGLDYSALASPVAIGAVGMAALVATSAFHSKLDARSPSAQRRPGPR